MYMPVDIHYRTYLFVWHIYRHQDGYSQTMYMRMQAVVIPCFKTELMLGPLPPRGRTRWNKISHKSIRNRRAWYHNTSKNIKSGNTILVRGSWQTCDLIWFSMLRPRPLRLYTCSDEVASPVYCIANSFQCWDHVHDDSNLLQTKIQDQSYIPWQSINSRPHRRFLEV